MTISLSKNVPSLMAMTLGMVSMIAPADAVTIYVQTSGGRLYSCQIDSYKNPYADCFNSMAAVCNTTDSTWSSDVTKKAGCHNAVDQIFGQLNTHWQNVRKECGQWSWNGAIGVYPSDNCNLSNANLMANGYYNDWNHKKKAFIKVPVTRSLTEYMNQRFWWMEKNICGEKAATTPPATYPSPKTPEACLPVGPLAKRALNSALVLDGKSYTCHTDGNKNPYADCLNSLAVLCNSNYHTFNKARCHTAVDQMFGQMNDLWQNVRKACGQWSFTTQDGKSFIRGNYLSNECASANADLMVKAIYTREDSVQVSVTPGLTGTINLGLWSNAGLA